MKIEHAAMYVNDLEGARGFFETYLGATANDMYHNAKTGFRSYFLSFDEGARLEIMNKPSMEDPEKTLNRTGLVHLRPCRLRHAATSVGREGVEVPSRALGIENAERKGGLSRAGDACDSDDLAQRHGHVDVLQVVHPCPADLDGLRGESILW